MTRLREQEEEGMLLNTLYYIMGIVLSLLRERDQHPMSRSSDISCSYNLLVLTYCFHPLPKNLRYHTLHLPSLHHSYNNLHLIGILTGPLP
jgi:hypothetical protein